MRNKLIERAKNGLKRDKKGGEKERNEKGGMNEIAERKEEIGKKRILK